MIDTTLAELGAKLPSGLPALCNITARISEVPQRVDGGRRWEIKLASPSGMPPVCAAVHIDPPNGAYGYIATDPNLLRIFKEQRLRSLLARDETITIQCVPRWNEEAQIVYLDVEAILIVRPWRTFGRREVDFTANCSRKHYLAITKAARTELSPPRLLTMHSLAGEIAHDLIEAAAHDLNSAIAATDQFIRESLNPATLLRLVILGMADPTALTSALGRGTDALKLLNQSETLKSLLRDGGPWYSESDQFDRGVTMSPDLIGDRVLLELKRITPNSFDNQREKFRRQIEAYLAWAMVRFGIDPVVTNWRASIINLHPEMPDQTRTETVSARREIIGSRIYRRHRLLALLDGNWLPPPTPTECSFCEFHVASEDEQDLPPICQYHCQVERGWSCHSVDGKGTECPLYEHCNCHAIYEPYERVDGFNRLRRELLVEEEDRELAAALIEEGAQVLGHFKIVSFQDGIIRLVGDPAMRVIDAAIPGVVYAIRSEQEVFYARFRRFRNDNWLFTLEGRAKTPPIGSSVQVIRQFDSAFPIRAQLIELERNQRLGVDPLCMRSSGSRSISANVEEHDSIAAVPSDVRCLIVDSPEPLQQREALREFFDLSHDRRQLILIGPSSDADFLPPDVMQLDEFSITEKVMKANAAIAPRLQTISREFAAHHRLVAPWDILFSGLVDMFLKTDRFQDVIVLDANAFPMLGLRRCFELASQRVVLMGSYLSGGPRAETANARASVLFQNVIRLLIETRAAILPEHVDRVGMVRMPVKAARGLGKLVGGSRLEEVIPIEVISIDGHAEVKGTIELVGEVPTVLPQQNRLRLKLTLDPKYPLSLREARLRLKHIAPEAIEHFRPGAPEQPIPGQGFLDESLLGVPVRLLSAAESLPGFQLPQHEVHFIWPQSALPSALSEGLTNVAEAEAVAGLAVKSPHERFIVTSPFAAQCRCVANMVAERRIDNVRVILPEKLGHRRVQSPPRLIVSLAATDTATAACWPLNDLGQLAPLLLGSWSRITILCAPVIMQHHPLVRHLTRLTGS